MSVLVEASTVYVNRAGIGKETNEVNTRSPFWDIAYWVFNFIMDVL